MLAIGETRVQGMDMLMSGNKEMQQPFLRVNLNNSLFALQLLLQVNGSWRKFTEVPIF